MLFVILSVGGLVLNQLIMWVGTEKFKLYDLVVKVLALFFVSVYNFVTRKIFLEKNKFLKRVIQSSYKKRDACCSDKI